MVQSNVTNLWIELCLLDKVWHPDHIIKKPLMVRRKPSKKQSAEDAMEDVPIVPKTTSYDAVTTLIRQLPGGMTISNLAPLPSSPVSAIVIPVIFSISLDM